MSLKRPSDADFERAGRTVRDMLDAREKRSTKPRLRRGAKPPPGALTMFEQDGERPGAYGNEAA